MFISGAMALLAVFHPALMAILGTVTPDRIQGLVVLGFTLLGPCVWALVGELFAPHVDDTDLFYQTVSSIEQGERYLSDF